MTSLRVFRAWLVGAAVTAVVAVLGCTPATTTTGDDDAGNHPVVLTGTPILASARLGTGDTLLGTTTDELFNQVNGDPIFAAHVEGTAPKQTAVHQVTLGWIQAERTIDLAANLGGWGLGTASLEASSATRYMSQRAYQIEYYVDVDLTMPASLAPPTGVYFVSKIFYGHSYEALFSGDSATFTAAVATMLPHASGAIQATAQQLHLTFSNVGRGLTPNGGEALFSMNETDVMNKYSSDGPAVPIYIEYRLIPGVAEPDGRPIPWVSTTKATIAIDEIDVFHNGSHFDASSTAWTIAATCKLSGAVVTQSQVWTHSSVSAGGSTVNPNGTGPQDPNASHPTSTYGRYASLPWSTNIPVNAGNVLECDLHGERTDPSTPVALPPVVIQIPVDTSSSVEGRAGNYDVGNGLDYQVHYSVTYTPN